MPRNATTGVFTRVSNSFSNPVFGTLIDPADADALFDDQDTGLNPAELAGPLRIINSLQLGTTGSAAGTLAFLNATSGSITVSPPAGALGTVTLTLPAETDMLIGRATTDTLTNKTFDTAGTGNSFSINGVAANANTGTGAVARATSPTFVTPALGTPTSGTLSNCTIPVTQITGFATGGATFLGTPSSANLAAFLTDETGTGLAVFGTSPTINTPNIVGTTAAGNASAGSVGEYVSSIIASGSAVTLATNTGKNLTSISLTAGDWDVWAIFNFITAASTNITQLIGSISTTTDTASLLGDRCGFTSYGSGGVVPGVLNCGSPMVQTRINVSGTTTIFAVAQASFTVAGLTVWGSLQARRVR